jgi:Xaa-Pro aminopeptidase
LENVRYLTGVVGHASLDITLLVQPRKIWVLATPLYTQALMSSRIPLVSGVWFESLPKVLKQNKIAQLGVEEHILSTKLTKQLRKMISSTKLVASGDCVEGMRLIKDTIEIGYLKKACQLSEKALGTVIAEIRVGMTEIEVAWRLERTMREMGCEDISFRPLIVAAGAHSAEPHHRPSTRSIRRGDIIQFDVGGVYKGYHADLSRVACVGVPTKQQLRVYDLILRVQKRAISMMRAGAQGGWIDSEVKEMIQKEGFTPYPHGLGHGIGLQRGAHEAPTISSKRKLVLQSGMCITVEPAIYLPRRYGMRVEDVVVVREDKAERLTTSSRSLRIIGS